MPPQSVPNLPKAFSCGKFHKPERYPFPVKAVVAHEAIPQSSLAPSQYGVSGGRVSGWPRTGCQGPGPFFGRVPVAGRTRPRADLSPRACGSSPLPRPSSTPTVSSPGGTQPCCPPPWSCLWRVGPPSGRFLSQIGPFSGGMCAHFKTIRRNCSGNHSCLPTRVAGHPKRLPRGQLRPPLMEAGHPVALGLSSF